MDDDRLGSRLARARLAGTQPITEDALLGRLRSEATTWVNAVRVQRARVEPSENRDPWEVEIDLHFLLVALVRLERAVARAADEVAEVGLALRYDLARFHKSVPGLRTMRDVGEHGDEYNLSKGRRSEIRRADVQNWSMRSTAGGGLVWRWLGHELDVDAATAAAGALYNSLDAALTPILGDSHRIQR
jgi:hypothetical protein